MKWIIMHTVTFVKHILAYWGKLVHLRKWSGREFHNTGTAYINEFLPYSDVRTWVICYLFVYLKLIFEFFYDNKVREDRMWQTVNYCIRFNGHISNPSNMKWGQARLLQEITVREPIIIVYKSKCSFLEFFNLIYISFRAKVPIYRTEVDVR